MSNRKKNQSARDEKNHVAKNKKFNIFPVILCVLIAFIIWLYASNIERNDKVTTNVNAQAATVVALPELL